MTRAYYISHPQVMQDAATPVPQWTLSQIGFDRLMTLKRADWVTTLSIIHASDERKAVDTAIVLARFADCRIAVHKGMGENDRSPTGYLAPPEFEATADAFFASPDVSVRGWERAIDAQARIVSAIESVLAVHDPLRPLAFSGHGGVGTLLLCHLMSAPISRQRDQPPGGGNVFAFDIATRRLLLPWTPLEAVAALPFT